MFSRKTNISDFSGKKAVWVIKIKNFEQKSTFNFANSTADIRQNCENLIFKMNCLC